MSFDFNHALAQLSTNPKSLVQRDEKVLHLLMILPAGTDWFEAPDHERVLAALHRRGKKSEELAKQPLAVELPGACLSVWIRLDVCKSTFDWHDMVRRALKPLFEEAPEKIALAVYGDEAFKARAARAAVYAAWLNGVTLTRWKSDKAAPSLQQIDLFGLAGLDFQHERALAEGNLLCRELTRLPPNLLTPASYREAIRTLAGREDWQIEEYDNSKLNNLKAGAFLAVARGSGHEDAAIVRLSYAPAATEAPEQVRGSAKDARIALVGKGICFDTGGHNLKPARYMHNMHDDMNGSAVVLGLLLAATRLALPVRIDAWLAIAQNHLSPLAYTQNEIVTALNGQTIEIVHTDAEGRMVLADTLALAVREKPDYLIDFATLTGSMAVALGERMSGVIGNRDELVAQAVLAGQASGERVVAFPMPADYDEALESQVADVKQCTLDSEADHILAARFLSRFVSNTPWLHVDLSASRCKDGLGAVASDITGFGVAFGLTLLEGLI